MIGEVRRGCADCEHLLRYSILLCVFLCGGGYPSAPEIRLRRRHPRPCLRVSGGGTPNVQIFSMLFMRVGGLQNRVNIHFVWKGWLRKGELAIGMLF